MRFLRGLSVVLLIGFVCSVVPTFANTRINLDAGSGILGNQAALDAFDRAAQNWEYYLGDNITLNIDIDMASLGTGILGSAGSSLWSGDFDYVRGLMASGGDKIGRAHV